ncbi:MAG: hypothetical protein M8364_08140 [Methylobacter sp.]|uniref:hypothetical protein n=1 Tax=Methylobacter sp. TaxID=2051955 RepID=UPI00258EF19C|nr:hypothetical protein [Methylobacter sp.]MCL7420856.1 hypothetical protein [Methylobacter sp.]
MRHYTVGMRVHRLTGPDRAAIHVITGIELIIDMDDKVSRAFFYLDGGTAPVCPFEVIAASDIQPQKI